jgi:hypothetical protein
MICKRATNEWTDDRRESKYSAKHAKQFWAILEASNLGDDLYHGYNCFVSVVRQRRQLS